MHNTHIRQMTLLYISFSLALSALFTASSIVSRLSLICGGHGLADDPVEHSASLCGDGGAACIRTIVSPYLSCICEFVVMQFDLSYLVLQHISHVSLYSVLTVCRCWSHTNSTDTHARVLFSHFLSIFAQRQNTKHMCSAEKYARLPDDAEANGEWWWWTRE